MSNKRSAPVEAGEALELAPERPLAASNGMTGAGELQLMPLFERALASPDGVGALTQLVELQERMQRRRAELDFYAALSEFQNTVPAVPKSSKADIVTKGGGKFSYTFADLEQIIETVRPHLSKNGLSFTFDSEVDGGKLTCTCILRHSGGHSVTSKFTLPTEAQSAMSEQQKVGAALTFAKRQALTAILGLALTDPEPQGAVATNGGTLTDEQVATLDSLIAEAGADRARFLSHLGVQSLGQLARGRYGYAVGLLEQKRKAAAP
ncbi:MAG: ERF family protein [Candidatus Eisenbacteria bacterium]